MDGFLVVRVVITTGGLVVSPVPENNKHYATNPEICIEEKFYPTHQHD